MTKKQRLRVVLFSFGYKYGSPTGLQLLLDVRFLPNPYWVKELRPGSGLDRNVADYVLESEAGKELQEQLRSLVELLARQNIAAQKKVMRLAVGCTGGRHRSVALTVWLADVLRQMDVDLEVFHRDIEKDNDHL
ncbi:RapZ C-terminal domain-containing protein [Desulforhopalus singaporensis]|uniref:UPF0042 nucleotide-binding protein n=1 Tax=Desulforhopalus singaporensis TaxID=91360 RepID=A0A1H0UGN4_9BACT|nr:RNase adapter RapZ [Desulforhopalus singaporensis]SDP65377.1 UPF0042 nucleotide-binding protein [Desulforhopalus singaporensis]